VSIWCSSPAIGQAANDAPRPGVVLTYADGFSNHYPDMTGSHEWPASVEIAEIAPWCVPGHEECDECDEHAGPWLRLSMWALGLNAAVVLDEAAARELAGDLLAWADRKKVTATKEGE